MFTRASEKLLVCSTGVGMGLLPITLPEGCTMEAALEAMNNDYKAGYRKTLCGTAHDVCLFHSEFSFCINDGCCSRHDVRCKEGIRAVLGEGRYFAFLFRPHIFPCNSFTMHVPFFFCGGRACFPRTIHVDIDTHIFLICMHGIRIFTGGFWTWARWAYPATRRTSFLSH